MLQAVGCQPCVGLGAPCLQLHEKIGCSAGLDAIQGACRMRLSQSQLHMAHFRSERWSTQEAGYATQNPATVHHVCLLIRCWCQFLSSCMQIGCCAATIGHDQISQGAGGQPLLLHDGAGNQVGYIGTYSSSGTHQTHTSTACWCCACFSTLLPAAGSM
jgi:hypothetical protein